MHEILYPPTKIDSGRDPAPKVHHFAQNVNLAQKERNIVLFITCLLYTSDAADE